MQRPRQANSNTNQHTDTQSHTLSHHHSDASLTQATRQRHAIDRHHPQFHQSRSIFDSISTPSSTVFSPPGSDPTLSPDQSRKKRVSACTGGHGEGHVGHTHTGSIRHEPDNNDRHESPTNPGDVDREATHAAMLMEGETVQSLFNVHKNTPVWASLGHTVLDFPGTSVGPSLC
jgi:hypothetical protein